ncbi:hypothetical protein GCHA_0172 [Paraglaciecola chathamensis S18K6]|uniref:Uncharacterized protein n=1 Tax=Paraglaciecola chathamensis S18K6 TaxID=1127672 RepID=A0AAV3USF9_9ALTE|nr:hypothetical protein GCHA_0172 [Paraglaciecola chathamensis S18K6]
MAATYSGGVIGASLLSYFGFNALLMPASALSYRVYRNKMKRRR